MRLWISPDGDLASSFSLYGNSQWHPRLSPAGWLTESNSNHWRTNWIEAGRTNNCILKWVLHYLFHCKALLTFYFSWIYDLISKGENISYPPKHSFTHCVLLSIYYEPEVLVRTGEAWWTHFCKTTTVFLQGQEL